MGYNTANTKWPTSVAIPDSDKSRIDTFFNLLDTDSPEVGDRLADEIFVEDGILSGPAGGVRGEALRKSRENAWTVIKQRKHDIISVYAHDKEGLDLVIHGEAMNVVNGTELKGQFLAKLQLAPNPAADGAHKIFSYEVYADFGGLHKQIAEALQKN